MVLFLLSAYVFLVTIICFIWVNEKHYDFLQKILATSAMLCLFLGLTLLCLVL